MFECIFDVAGLSFLNVNTNIKWITFRLVVSISTSRHVNLTLIISVQRQQKINHLYENININFT